MQKSALFCGFVCCLKASGSIKQWIDYQETHTHDVFDFKKSDCYGFFLKDSHLDTQTLTMRKAFHLILIQHCIAKLIIHYSFKILDSKVDNMNI